VLLREAAAEIERLRAIMPSESDSPQPVASTPEPHATHGEGTRQERCTLTDAEREAVERARQTLDAVQDLAPTATADDAMAAATLRGLLERTDRT
jgi:hypothetical protein